MDGRLKLDLTITDRPPAAPDRPAGTRQAWVGGAVDRESRRMIPEPRRWLTLIEHVGSPDAAPPIPGALHDWWLEQVAPGAAPSPEGAGGLVLVSMDVDPAVEEEFNDWYTTEHIPLLSAVPGMIRARRFRALTGQPAYVALYHVETTDIYATEAWTSANYTPWMLRMRRFQRNRTYFMFHPAEVPQP
ncbi:DUF4286 family protein [uncultured Enterovirga sp.]|uniref:DUF4286 family protein n=1 Tax=uncultured Enterovirga sp. TaxID=2026352 RepID=UPI0035CBEA7A